LSPLSQIDELVGFLSIGYVENVSLKAPVDNIEKIFYFGPYLSNINVVDEPNKENEPMKIELASRLMHTF